MITDSAAPDVECIFGTAFKEDMQDEMIITVIAAGFGGTDSIVKVDNGKLVDIFVDGKDRQQQKQTKVDPRNVPPVPVMKRPEPVVQQQPEPEPQPQPVPVREEPKAAVSQPQPSRRPGSDPDLDEIFRILDNNR